MGHSKSAKAAKVGTDYNWGAFGSANERGVNLSPMANANIGTAQAGTSQYLNELLNPSYNSESFRARQDLLDSSNQQYANQLGANAIERGARGSATQNILNSIMANRNNNMRTAMTQEDQRIANILNQTQGVESNYFNQGNMMANNILQRVMANQSAQNAVNMANTQAENQRRNGLMSAIGGIGGAVAGAGLGSLFSAPASGAASAAFDPGQYLSANNLYGG